MDNEVKDLLDKIKGQFEDSLKSKGYATKEEVENALTEKMKAVEGLDVESLKSLVKGDVMSILQKQGAEITALKEKGTKPQDMTIRGQVAEWHTKNREAILKIKSGQKAELPAFELKTVASPMTPANSLNSSAYLPNPFIQSGLNDLWRVKPTFWDYIPKGRTSAASYVWVNKKDPEGSADFIGAGVAKPGISFELATEISNAKKVAVSNKTAVELLDDIDGMASYIEGELTYQLKRKVNETLMAGTGSSTVPDGIQNFSQTYTLTGISTINPNNFDAIRAAVAQVRVNYIDLPVTVFVNPVDFANMELTKAVDSGVYLLPPFSTSDGRSVAGATIVEDNNVEAGYFQVAVLPLLKTLIYKDFSIQYGWEDDDFTKNLVTVIAEMRLHFFHSENDEQGFIYDTFSNVISAITAS